MDRNDDLPYPQPTPLWPYVQVGEQQRSNPKIAGSIPTMVNVFLFPYVDPIIWLGLDLNNKPTLLFIYYFDSC